MASSMNINDLAKTYLKKTANPKGTYVDFTMGNGRDTEFLCSLAPDGTVYAFDIQEQALENTRALLNDKGYKNAKLILDGHENVKSHITEPIDGGIFNLGHLPGGDIHKHTMRYTTLKAVVDAMELLKSEATLMITVNPKYPEGEAEGILLADILSGYNPKEYGIMTHRMMNTEKSPYLYEIIKY